MSGAPEAERAAKPPNLVLLITDQQRFPCHWPGGDAWVRELMPNDAELARTGLTFRRAFVNTAMCSPSRASLYTGLHPAQHGVTLTLTDGGVRPRPRNFPAVTETFVRSLATPGAPRSKLARAFARGALRRSAPSEQEQVLRPETPNLARLLAEAGYNVAFKGKWHLTKPVNGERWSEADTELLDSAYGFAGWEPPDAGENIEPEHFGGGDAGASGQGFDEDYTRQAERFLADPPEPFALIVSLVNPHDVLGYPRSYRQGGYDRGEFRDLGVGLPSTYGESLAGKPSAHGLMKMGQTAFLGPIRGRRAALDYVNFYAHLHRLVDAKLGRILAALGDAGDPGSLRSRTVVVRTSDHGEMGLAHGGLRQKMFNAYEETVHVPFVVSNPVLYPEAQATDALASLVDVMPTLAAVAGAPVEGLGLRGVDLSPVLARHAAPERERAAAPGADLARLLEHPAPAPSVRELVHFTYDDHKAGSALADVVPRPNRIRCVRDAETKYAAYVDPDGRVPAEYELYDLTRDPEERVNLVDPATGRAREPADRGARERMHEALLATMEAEGTAPPAGI